MIELYRRIILIAGVTVAVCMAMFADLKPRIAVQQIDFALEQKDPGFMKMLSEKNRYLATLPLDKYIQEVTKDRLLQPEDSAMQSFAEQANRVLAHPHGDSGWQHQLGPGPTLWLKLNDIPLDSPRKRFSAETGKTLYLLDETQENTQYLQLTLHTYSSDKFSMGFGYSGDGTPPAHLFYPLRNLSWIPILIALLFYIFYPGPKRDQTAMSIARWRIMLGDGISIMFFTLFFGLPLFISEAVQAFYSWSFFALFLWPLAFCGLWMLKCNGWYASFEINFIPGGMHLKSFSLDEKILYSQLKKVSPAVLKNPRWLTFLMALGALASSGSNQVRMAGQATLLASASYGGLRFLFKDGRSFYLWSLDQFGNAMFSGVTRLLNEIKTAKLFDEKDIIEKRTIATEITIETAKGKQGSIKKSRPLMKLSVTPVAILFLFFFIGTIAEKDTDKPANTADATETGNNGIPKAAPDLPLLEKSEKGWQQTIGGGQIVYGEYVLQAENNDIVTLGKTYSGRSDILLVRTDQDGNVRWKQIFGDEGNEQPDAMVSTPGGSFVIAATKSTSSNTYRDIYLFEVDGEGELTWETTYGETSVEESAEAMALNRDGTLSVLADINGKTYLMSFSSNGKLGSQIMLTSDLPDQRRLTGRDIIATSDGNLIVCGELERTGSGFMDAFLMKLDPSGNRLWVKTYGGEDREGANSVREMTDGSFLLTGYKGLFGEGQQDILLVRTDSSGELLWQKVLGGQDDDQGEKIVSLHENGAMILGRSILPETSISYSTLYQVGLDGTEDWHRWLGRNIQADDIALLNPSEFIITGMQNRSKGLGIQGDLVLFTVKQNR